MVNLFPGKPQPKVHTNDHQLLLILIVIQLRLHDTNNDNIKTYTQNTYKRSKKKQRHYTENVRYFCFKIPLVQERNNSRPIETRKQFHGMQQFITAKKLWVCSLVVNNCIYYPV